ncbi:hypothetical protein ACVFYP_06760 [Roseomonas sp. F4]
MAKVVAPEYDVTVREAADHLTFETKAHSGARMALGITGAVITMLVAIFALPLGLMAGNGTAITAGLAAVAGAVFSFRFANSKKTVPIRIDRTSITAGGKTYLLDHVGSIGFDSTANNPTFIPGGNTMANSIAVAGAMARQAAGHYIYITYGSKRVPIITGLTPHNVDDIYRQVCGFLARFGHNYNQPAG